MKALVTGGGGFLGGAVVATAPRSAATPSARSPAPRYPWLDELGVEQVLGDLADPDAVERAVAGCDVVFHVAAKAGVWGRYADFFATNVTGTENVIAACKKHGVRKLVYTSTPSVVHAGGDIEGGERVAAVPEALRAVLPRDEGHGREGGAGRERPGPRHGRAAPAPDLGPRRPAPRSRASSPGPRSGKLRRIGSRPVKVDVTYIDNAADAHLHAADRLDVGIAARGQGVLHLQRRAGGAVGVHRPRPGRGRAAAGDADASSAWKARLAGRRAGMGVLAASGLPGEPPMTRFVARQLRRRTGTTSRPPGGTSGTSRGYRSKKDCGDWASGCGRGRRGDQMLAPAAPVVHLFFFGVWSTTKMAVFPPRIVILKSVLSICSIRRPL